MNSHILLGAAAFLAISACEGGDTPGQPETPPASPPTAATEGSDAPLVAEGPAAPESPEAPTTDDPAAPAAAPAPGAPPALPDFQHDPPGKLPAGSGSGAADQTIWAPNMRFPMEKAPAWANSQVYGAGGSNGPAGGQCDTRNYSYPWRDNFCETRGYANMFCGNGKGHQGQDIRPATCKKAEHVVVAAETGTITGIGTYTVFLTAKSGRLFRYLHMDMKKVRQNLHVGQEVARGQPIGVVSNDFGATATTIHLHLEIKAPVTRDGKTVFTFVPPYPSLVLAYQRLLSVSPDAPR